MTTLWTVLHGNQKKGHKGKEKNLKEKNILVT
jgi:hypothetical protein